MTASAPSDTRFTFAWEPRYQQASRCFGGRLSSSVVKELSGVASVVVGADEDAARSLVRDVEHYPQWHGDTVREVQVLSRDAQGRAERVHSRLRASFGPLDRDFEIML